MEFTNLNILTIFLYILISFLAFYIAFLGYKKQIFINNNFKKLSAGKYFYIKYLFLILSFLILIFSIFGIRYGISDSDKTNGIDIVFVLDVSKSMNVADLGNDKTRLDFAKESINNFISNNLNNRYGLVIFSGDAVSSVPLTSDLNLFISALNNVDYRNLTLQGTNFSKAFELAYDRLSFSDDKSKALVFLSDGGEGEDAIDFNYLKSLKKEDIEIFIGGIGTNKGGKIINGVDVFGRVSYQTYMGDYVISKINEDNLKNLANIFESEYLKIGKVSDLNNFEKRINNIEKKVIENNLVGSKLDYSRQLSFISFFFFLLYIIFYLFEDKFNFFKNKKGIKK